MSVVMFSQDDSFYVRKAVFRMIIERAKTELEHSADIEELEVAELTEGISLFRLPTDQSTRIGTALWHGTQRLRSEVISGSPTEEPVREGIESLLDEFAEFMQAHLSPSK